MADKKKEKILDKKQDKEKAQEKPQGKNPMQEEEYEVLVRIMDKDILGSKNLYTGLTKIRGVSWAISNALCLKLGFPRNKKISELTKPEILKIESFMENMPIADFLKNRRSDIETGETKHYLSSDLDIKKEFDIKRLKEIKSYKGIRHAAKLPVRGQRTRSHFRTRGIAMGVKRKKS
ncbi:30S ribosomal protein S13 [Candidatus Pacearchaeota archaeon]|nr:30S ribosomal protein S13 [Candidatus Pacearchaeota archaeon]